MKLIRPPQNSLHPLPTVSELRVEMRLRVIEAHDIQPSRWVRFYNSLVSYLTSCLPVFSQSQPTSKREQCNGKLHTPENRIKQIHRTHIQRLLRRLHLKRRPHHLHLSIIVQGRDHPILQARHSHRGVLLLVRPWITICGGGIGRFGVDYPAVVVDILQRRQGARKRAGELDVFVGFHHEGGLVLFACGGGERGDEVALELPDFGVGFGLAEDSEEDGGGEAVVGEGP